MKTISFAIGLSRGLIVAFVAIAACSILGGALFGTPGAIIGLIVGLVCGLLYSKFFGSGETDETPTQSAPEPEPINVSNEIMNAAFPDRSAGRECITCNQYGSHHTDQHNIFATAALDKTKVSFPG